MGQCIGLLFIANLSLMITVLLSAVLCYISVVRLFAVNTFSTMATCTSVWTVYLKITSLCKELLQCSDTVGWV